MISLWYKNAVLYELDVKTFQDSNDDGIGDFPGLTRRLPYLAGMGASCLWLRPFFPSPLRDDGYDITDYYSIDSRLGTFGEFVDFMAQARELGLRVLVDLVLNHTSIDHPWFQAARRDKHSPYRDYYVWSPDEPPKETAGLVFPGEQDANWTYDEQARAWYFHRFYWHQPDLNTDHPAVRREFDRIIGFWIELGLSGFRVDAAPFLLEQVGGKHAVEPFVQPEHFSSTSFRLLRELRLALSWRRGDAVFLAEANVPDKVAPEFFGPGDDRMHMLFNFALNQCLMLALADRRAAPLIEHLKGIRQESLGAGQWVNFLRNHDELDLGALSGDERQRIFARFAPDKAMQIYGRGIRRRLAPMLGGDAKRLELAHALLLALPGTPMIRYGEEIGMGEDLSLPGRTSVRTPMQWSDDESAGFSAAPPDKLFRPPISDGAFSYEHINVAAQQKQPDSLLSCLERLIRVRRECPEFGRGRFHVLEVDHPAIFAVRHEFERGAVIAVHNLSDQSASVQLDLDTGAGESLTDLLGNPSGESSVQPQMTLPGYAFRWMRIVGHGWQAR